MKALTVLFLFIAAVNCGFDTMANFTAKYSAVFEVKDDPIAGPNSLMQATLIFEGLPLEVEENGGMWLGIGFSTTMLGADLIIC